MYQAGENSKNVIAVALHRVLIITGLVYLVVSGALVVKRVGESPNVRIANLLLAPHSVTSYKVIRKAWAEIMSEDAKPYVEFIRIMLKTAVVDGDIVTFTPQKMSRQMFESIKQQLAE